MERLLHSLAVAAIVLASVRAEVPPPAGLVNGDVEAGTSGWRPYETAVPRSALAVSPEGPHAGRQSLRLDTPGKSRLEGLTADLVVQPGRAYRIDAWLRGGGTLMLAVLKQQGWVYGNPFTASAGWSRQSLGFLADAGAASLSILTTGPTPQAVTLWVDDVALSEELVPDAPAAEVPPFRIEAEEYRARATGGTISADPGASGGAYVVARRYYWLAYDVPLVPQTATPFFIYLRARTERGTSGRLALLRAVPGQPHEVLGSAAVPEARWGWIRTGPHVYRMGKTFCVSSATANTEDTVALDAIVIATNGALADSDLNPGARAP